MFKLRSDELPINENDDNDDLSSSCCCWVSYLLCSYVSIMIIIVYSHTYIATMITEIAVRVMKRSIAY